MKKIVFFAAAVAAIAFASCGNKQPAEAQGESADTVSFEQSQIEQKIMLELDSIADIWNKLPPVAGIFENGKINLSEEELKVKPDYLLSPDTVSSLSLLSQKYRAIGMLVVDMKIAEIYKMDADAYKAAITKIATDVNIPSNPGEGNVDADRVRKLYQESKDNNLLNFFWESAAAINIEQLYIISNNAEKLLPAFDDAAASNFTYHIALLKLALDDLSEYDNNIKGLVSVLAPLNELNAIDVKQFKEQIEKMKPQIQAARESLLK